MSISPNQFCSILLQEFFWGNEGDFPHSIKNLIPIIHIPTVMKDINGDNTQILRTMQDMTDYLLEKCDVLEEVLEEKTGKPQPEFSESQKRRLAYRGRKLNEYLLSVVEPTFAPGTVHGWYRELVGRKYDSTGQGQRKRGRKPVRRRSSKRCCTSISGIQIGVTTASPELCGISATMFPRLPSGRF